jgi:hypothetical protein
MDYLEKFEVHAEQQVAELDDARSKLAVEVVSMDHGGGGRCDGIFEQEEEAQEEMGGRATGSLRSFVQWNSQQMIARAQRRSRTQR